MRRQVQTCHRQPARAQIEKLSMPQQETGTRPVEHAKNEGTVTDTRVDNQDNLSDAPSGGHLCVDNISWTSSGTTSDERTTPDFVDALTDQETSQAFVGPRLHASFIGANDRLAKKSLKEVLEELESARDEQIRTEIRSFLCITKIPTLARKKDIESLAEVLTSRDQQVVAVAGSKLETLLLQLQSSGDNSPTNRLLIVADATRTAFKQQSEDSNHINLLANLHLTAVSALSTLGPRPAFGACASFAVPAQTLQQPVTDASVKQRMERVFQEFYETFQGRLENPSSFEILLDMDRHTRSSCFRRASFPDLIVYAFVLLSELVNEGSTTHVAVTLLEGLKDLSETAVPKTGESRLRTDAVTVLEEFIIRGLAVLLRTTFNDATTPIGKLESTHINLLRDLVTGFVEKADVRLKIEISDITFHSAMNKQEIFKAFQKGEKPLPHHPAFYCMEKLLQRISLRINKSHVGGEGTACGWRETSCSLGKMSGEIAFYQREASCLDKCGIYECMKKLPKGKMAASEDHKRNLEYLVKLSPGCKHIIDLLAFQLKPFPFYVTEAVEGRRLLGYLLDHRRAECWIETHILLSLVMDIITALQFLEERRLVNRNVTAYNMIISSKKSQGTIGSRFSQLSSPDKIVKLVDLGLTHEYDSDDPYKETLRVRDQGPIPVRWTAPEALFKGRHTDESMVYSLGCVMYELWTHGCEPFTTHGDTTEELLKQMYEQPGTVRLYTEWPGIPKSISEIIQLFTETCPKRPGLWDAKEKLEIIRKTADEKALAEREGNSVSLWESALGNGRKYPTVSSSQKERRHIPETGIPHSVKQLIYTEHGRYRNVGKDVHYPPESNAVTDIELSCSDLMTVNHENGRTVVKEVVTPGFVKDVLPSLEACSLPCVTCWGPQITHDDVTQPEAVIHERSYQPCKELKTEAKRKDLWKKQKTSTAYDMIGDDVGQRALRVIHSLVCAVVELHERGICHCDIKAANILLNKEDKVILARIGRMHLLPSLSADAPLLVDLDTLEDSRRWLAPEVLISRHFGPPNDVFMLGTTIWEIFWIREVVRKNPRAKDRDFAPCTNLTKKQVLVFVRNGEHLVRPEGCPDWLYNLIVDCRHPEPSQRPTAVEVKEKIEEVLSNHTSNHPVSTMSITDPEKRTLPPRVRKDTSACTDVEVTAGNDKHNTKEMYANEGTGGFSRSVVQDRTPNSIRASSRLWRSRSRSRSRPFTEDLFIQPSETFFEANSRVSEGLTGLQGSMRGASTHSSIEGNASSDEESAVYTKIADTESGPSRPCTPATRRSEIGRFFLSPPPVRPRPRDSIKSRIFLVTQQTPPARPRPRDESENWSFAVPHRSTRQYAIHAVDPFNGKRRKPTKAGKCWNLVCCFTF